MTDSRGDSFSLGKSFIQGYSSHDVTYQRRSTNDERALYENIRGQLITSLSAARCSGDVDVDGVMYRCFGMRAGDDWVFALNRIIDVIPALASLGVTRSDLSGLAEAPGLTLICSDFGNGKTTTLFSLVAGLGAATAGRTCYLVDRTEYAVPDKYSVSRVVGRDVESFAAGIHDAVYAKHKTIVVDSLADESSAAAAVYAASLGYRVLACVSADSAISGLRWLFAHTPVDTHRRVPRALSGVWAQRLIKKDGKAHLVHESLRADTLFCRLLGSKRIEAEDVHEAIARQSRQGFWDLARKHIREGLYDRTDALQVLSEHDSGALGR